MALIQCPECRERVSDKAEMCIHCGYPLQKVQGKVMIKASNAFIGLFGKYNIYDCHMEKIASLKAGGIWEIDLESDTVFFAKYSGAFSDPQRIECYADQINKFLISIENDGFEKGFCISRVGIIDSD